MRLRQLATLVLTLVIASVLLCACTSSQTDVQTGVQVSSPVLSASEVVTHYFSILNTGMKSGNFSALDTVYASDATFTRSTLDGKTTVYHGLTDITSFYNTLPTKAPGYQWTTDHMSSPSPTVVLAYEHAGTSSMTLPSRCAHVFVVQNGKIVSYDWVVFFPGQK